MWIFSKNNLNILTTEVIFKGQRFAILAMFFVESHNLSMWQWLQTYLKVCNMRCTPVTIMHLPVATLKHLFNTNLNVMWDM